MTLTGPENPLRILTCLAALALCVGSCTKLSGGTPVPTYGTFFGGSGDTNVAVAVAVDPSGNVIVAGYTTSQTLPATANAFQPQKASGFPDNQNVFLAKFDPTGRTLLWATFLGGDLFDQPTALAVDASGDIYVTGTTQSSNFPVTPGAYQSSSTGSGSASSFLSKISPDGSALLYSMNLYGFQSSALAVSASGEAYVAGLNTSESDSFVTAGAVQIGGTSSFDAMGISLLCAKSDGTGLVFGAYLGGGGMNGSRTTSITLNPQGDVYVAGYTGEVNIPTTANAFQRQYSNPGNPGISELDGVFCCSNGFLIEVNATGSQVLYGTYFGPQYFGTAITSISITSGGSLYFAGITNASSLQATPGAFEDTASAGFIAKLTPGSTVLDSFSYLPINPSIPPFIAVGNQPTALYVVFAKMPLDTGFSAFQIVELSTPTLALISTLDTSTYGALWSLPPPNGPLALILGPPHSAWIVGSCIYCSLGGLVSSDAFQFVPSGTGENAFLLQLTDISPTISFVGSSATGSSPFAAGQLISIYGTQLGPTPGSVGQENPNGAVTNSDGGTQVLFDGVAAPILYTSATQINTAIPCSVAGKASTQMVVQYLGASSSPFTVPLSAAAPGIFTINGSGSGEAVVLNQDYTLNGPSNPAARGSAVSFYATGIGPTSPCVDGQTYQTNFPLATLPVIAGVGNLGAQVLYAGQAPYFMTGVDQINIVVPSGSPTGSVPLSLLVNGIFSPPGVTIAVK